MDDMKKLTRGQKEDLTHFILNVLMNHETGKLLEKVKSSPGDEITLSKKDAGVILDNLFKIRKFILDIPILEGEVNQLNTKNNKST